jgi:HK97 family phage portal protein
MANKVFQSIQIALQGGISSTKKEFIPTLASMDTFFGVGLGSRIKTYKLKQEQVNANIGWVFAANSAISEACASVPLHLYQLKSDGDREEIMTHDILDLLDTPNASHTGEQFRQLHFTYMNLTGESYLLKMMGSKPLEDNKKLPLALHIMPSHHVDFILGKDYWTSVVKLDNVEYPIKAVIRDINPDPNNPYKGRSIISASAATIDTDDQMKEWNRRFFANSARPSVTIEIPDTMEDKAYNRYQQQLNDAATGTEAAFKPLILEGGAKASPYMMSQQDLDFLESRKFSKDEILAMFRLSPAMLGMTENVNRSNAESAEYIFAKYVVLPRVRQFVQTLNATLVKPFDATLVLDFDNPVPDDVQAKREDAVAGIDKWLTINETRALYDYEALPEGGEELYRPLSEVPLSMLGSIKPTAGTSDATDNGDGTANADEPAKALDLGKKKDDLPEVDAVKLYGERKALLYNRYAAQYESKFMKVMRFEFIKQEKTVLQAIIDRKLGKAFKKKGIVDDLISWQAANAQMKKATQPLLALIVGETGKLAMGEVSDTIDFDPFQSKVTGFYDERSTAIAKDVNAETEKQLKATLTEGISQGETTTQLSTRVRDVFGNASTMRADRIARSEVARAQGFADISAWTQSGVVSGKQWYTAEDTTVCEFCASMDGIKIDLEQNFFDKGDEMSSTSESGKDMTMTLGYEDIEHPPLHNNCRCVLIPITG